jgi:hypothetical protein
MQKMNSTDLTKPTIVIVKHMGAMGARRSIYSIFHTITALFAIYLSFKCNNGLAIGDFLLACCCPVLYIIYRAATSNFCSFPIVKKV